MKNNIKIDIKKFKDGDVVQSCKCGWQTPSSQEAIAKCPECHSRVVPVLRVEKKAAKQKSK